MLEHGRWRGSAWTAATATRRGSDVTRWPRWIGSGRDGEAGVGKTRLLRYAADQAGDIRVVRLVGIESETRLAYGAPHRLLRPLLGGLGRLPRQQRDALTGACGLTSAAPADRLPAGLATLTLLADTATELPLLCLVDDVHRLDRESAEALAFAARRLHADSLGMVFAARLLQRGVLDGVTGIHLDGLAPDQARALLAHDVAGHLDAGVADLIVAGTGGNPRALRELVAELSAEQLAGGGRRARGGGGNGTPRPPRPAPGHVEGGEGGP